MMRRNKKSLPLLEKVEISGIAAEGVAIARVKEKVVFVPWLAPGDIADIQITKSKSSYMKGRAVKIHTFSDLRTQPFCKHFGICGGCKWQHITYDTQLFYKHQQLVDSLERIAHIKNPPVKDIIPAKKTREYRNKLEFTFSSRRWLNDDEIVPGEEIAQKNGLGFHLSGIFDKVLDIHECHLMPDFVNEIRNGFREYALQNALEFYDYRKYKGFLRNLLIRSSNSGDIMVILVTGSYDEDLLIPAMNFLGDSFPQISSLHYIVNTKVNDSLSDQKAVLFSGSPFITENMEGLKYKISPLSFFQTNSEQAVVLYNLVKEYASLSGKEVVYDLYTGTGTIANFVADNAAKVVGIEYVEDAIADAEENSRLNNIKNTSFFAGDMLKVLTDDFIAFNGRPDVVIADPPRAGMHKDVVMQIVKTAPARIVYVSCNPATQARDIEMMKDSYELISVQAVDMFPHTHHVENVALLKLKDNMP